MAQISPIPFKKVVVEAANRTWLITHDWRRWLQEVKDRIDRIASQIGSAVSLTAQGVGSSGIAAAVVEAGLYRVSWLLRITQAATTSSSVQLTIGATSGGSPSAQTGAALTTNTLGAALSGSFLVAADAASNITYTLAYGSVGATPMQFAASMSVEAVPA